MSGEPIEVVKSMDHDIDGCWNVWRAGIRLGTVAPAGTGLPRRWQGHGVFGLEVGPVRTRRRDAVADVVRAADWRRQGRQE